MTCDILVSRYNDGVKYTQQVSLIPEGQFKDPEALIKRILHETNLAIEDITEMNVYKSCADGLKISDGGKTVEMNSFLKKQKKNLK